MTFFVHVILGGSIGHNAIGSLNLVEISNNHDSKPKLVILGCTWICNLYALFDIRKNKLIICHIVCFTQKNMSSQKSEASGENLSINWAGNKYLRVSFNCNQLFFEYSIIIRNNFLNLYLISCNHHVQSLCMWRINEWAKVQSSKLPSHYFPISTDQLAELLTEC